MDTITMDLIFIVVSLTSVGAFIGALLTVWMVTETQLKYIDSTVRRVLTQLFLVGAFTFYYTMGLSLATIALL